VREGEKVRRASSSASVSHHHEIHSHTQAGATNSDPQLFQTHFMDPAASEMSIIIEVLVPMISELFVASSVKCEQR